jgi:hypothetical protein
MIYHFPHALHLGRRGRGPRWPADTLVQGYGQDTCRNGPGTVGRAIAEGCGNVARIHRLPTTAPGAAADIGEPVTKTYAETGEAAWRALSLEEAVAEALGGAACSVMERSFAISIVSWGDSL